MWRTADTLMLSPVMPVNRFSCEAFIGREGRIPAPIHSFKN